MHFYRHRRQRISLSWYAPDGGWVPDRPTPRSWKEDEARCSRKERTTRKRLRGHHMRCTWEAQGFRSPEWTTCGGFILGPPRGTWAQYPRSKGMRQRDVRLFRRALRVLEQVLARASRLWSAGTYLLEEDARRDSQHREGLVAFVTDRSETTLRTVPSHVNGFRVLVVVGDSQAWATGPSLPTWEETKTKDAWRASQREAKRAASARRLARKLVSTRRAA